MDISIVIAAHNQRDRLRLVLSGLAVQTFSEGQFEVIIVDDGSTDGTGDFLREYEQISYKSHSLEYQCRTLSSAEYRYS